MDVVAETRLFGGGEFLGADAQILRYHQLFLRQSICRGVANSRSEGAIRAGLQNLGLGADEFLEALEVGAAVFNRPITLRRHQAPVTDRLIDLLSGTGFSLCLEFLHFFKRQQREP